MAGIGVGDEILILGLNALGRRFGHGYETRLILCGGMRLAGIDHVLVDRLCGLLDLAQLRLALEFLLGDQFV